MAGVYDTISTSMGTEEVRQGFSVVNRFFNYGVEAIDVIQFDAKITTDAMTFRRARREVQLTGRGGTNFGPVLAYEEHYRSCYPKLQHLGQGAYLKANAAIAAPA